MSRRDYLILSFRLSGICVQNAKKFYHTYFCLRPYVRHQNITSNMSSRQYFCIFGDGCICVLFVLCHVSLSCVHRVLSVGLWVKFTECIHAIRPVTLVHNSGNLVPQRPINFCNRYIIVSLAMIMMTLVRRLENVSNLRLMPIDLIF